MSTNKVYIGGLGDNVEEEELREAFSKYGEIEEIVLKSGYGFILMTDSNDAEDAIKALHDTTIGGRTVTVEKPRDRTRGGPRGGRGMSRGGSVRNCYNCGIPGHLQRDCRRAPQGGFGGPPRDGGFGGPRDGGYGGGYGQQEFSRGGGGYGGFRGGRGRGGPMGGGGGPRTCYNCNEPGHIARECPTGNSGGDNRY